MPSLIFTAQLNFAIAVIISDNDGHGNFIAIAILVMAAWGIDMNGVRLSILQLKQLLIDIKEHGPGICVRFRMLGEMWQQHFVRVIAVSDHRVLVNDEYQNKLISIDLNHVVQFEADNKYKTLQPNFHYEVVPNFSF